MNNLDNGNIIYDKDSALICLNCKFNLNINDINIKNIKCGNCNKELKNYQLISCNKCNYNFYYYIIMLIKNNIYQKVLKFIHS